MPRCKNCKVKFDAKFFNQKYCLQSEECRESAIMYAVEQVEKVKAKEWKVRKEALRDKTKSLSSYKNDLQKEINTIVRLIDKGKPCIATGATTGKMNAGHYWGVGSNDTIRYNLHNIHIQSEHSNTYNSGDTLRYQEGIKNTYGNDYLEMINDLKKTPLIKLSALDIKEKIVIAKEIIKYLKDGRVYSELERIFLRSKYNDKLGIYK